MIDRDRPPRWVERTLVAVLPKGQSGDGIVGDLREEFDALAQTRGRRFADAWYLATAASIGVRYALKRAFLSLRRRKMAGAGRISKGGMTMMSDVVRDSHFALRSLRNSPGFTVSAVLILAIGTGGTTALYSLVDAVLLSPLSYPEPDQLVQIWERSPQGDDRTPVSAGSAFTWQDEAESLQGVGMYWWGSTTSLTIDGTRLLVTRSIVHPEVFTALDVPPLIGRGFRSGDATSGERIAVLSHATWRTDFGEDGGVVGRSILLDDLPHIVIGVMPRGFDFPATGSDLWTALPEGSPGASRGDFGDHTLSVVGRLRPGLDPETAEAELTTFAARRAQDDPNAEGWGVNVVPLQQEVTAGSALLLASLFAGAFIVLLVGCANLANLLLARGVLRAPEIALRSALGAGRRRILGQLATENVLIGGLGCGAGILASILLLRAFVEIAPGDIPLLDRAVIDGGAMRFALAVAIGCTVLFGLAPALRQTAAAPQLVLRGARGSIGLPRGRAREVLLASQVALAVVLVVGGGLFVRTVMSLTTTDLGFDQTRLATMSIVLPGARYATPESRTQLVDRLVAGVGAVPGVLSVTEAMRPPGSNSVMTVPFTVEGREGPRPDGTFDPEDLRWVWSGYFETVGQEVTHGRGITGEDRSDSRLVVVVNETFAARIWPNESPIGQRIAHYQRRGEWLEVIGVVSDARLEGPDRDPLPRMYVPYAQHTLPFQRFGTVIARVSRGVELVAVHEGMRTALADIDLTLLPWSLGTVEDAYRAGLSRRSFAMVLALSFAASVLLLCGFGLHGLVSFTVASRTREIGLRIALGGRGPSVATAVVRHTMTLVVVGAVIGGTVSVFATRWIESLLYGVERVDGVTYLTTAIAVAAVALVAASMPAFRAMRVDPVKALSTE